MAEARPALFWGMKKSLGPYRIVDKGKGKVIVCMKGGTPTFVDPVDEENRDIRIKSFSGSGHISSVLKEVIDLGYREAKSPCHPVNLFVEDNALTLCTASRDEKKKIVKTYDFLKMKVAGGTLDPVTVEVKYDAETRVFSFTQEPEVIIGGRAYADDQLHVCLFEGEKERAMLGELRTRGESGLTSILLPKGWDVTKTYIYAFAVSANKRLSSPSTRVYPAPTESELLDLQLADLQAREQEIQELARQEVIAERKRQMIQVMIAAREASGKAREEAIAAGKSVAEARAEENRLYDQLMEAAREEQNAAEEERVEAEERHAAELREREAKNRQKAKERRAAIAARVAAEREEERLLRRAEREERRRKIEDAKGESKN